MNIAGTGFVTVLLVFQCIVLARGEQPDTNVYRINLTGKGTLKDVFDAGLRPKRWDSSLANECFVEDKHIAFRVTDNHTATILASYCYFQVYADGSLSSVKAESASLTSEDARKWMLPILAAFGKDTQELDAYLARMRSRSATADRSPILAQERSLSVGMPWPGAQSDKPSLGIALFQKWDAERPFQIKVEIGWARPYSSMRSAAGPLQPPPGYEGFRIDTVPYFAEWIRKGEAPPPDVERRFGKEGIQRLRDEYKASKGMTDFSRQPQPSPSPVSASPPITELPQESPASTFWPKWLPIGASLAALFGWMVWRRLRSKI